MKNPHLPIVHSEFIPELTSFRILLDTNFIIESNRYYNNFTNLIEELKAGSKELFTLEVIKKEFLYGIQTKSELQDLDNFFQQIISNVDTNINCFSNHLQTVTILYRNYKRISLEDFMIVSYLIDNTECILLTKNHSDFPLRLFNRLGFIISEYEDQIQHYAFYKVDEAKMKNLLNDFNKTS